MTCEDYQELLSAYVDDELDQAEKQQVESHVVLCSKCQETVKTYQRFQKSLQIDMVRAEGLVGFEGEVIQQIRQLRREVQARRLALVVVLILVLGMGVALFLVISPFGVVAEVLFRLTFYTIHGYLYSLQATGSVWYSALIIACAIFASLSLFGIIRLLRTVKREVVL